MLNDGRFANLYTRVTACEFLAVFAAPPCSTFSISRFIQPRDGSDGAPVVRERGDQIRGLEKVPGGHERELKRANRVVARTAAILHAAASVGTEFIMENPADRGDETDRLRGAGERPLLVNLPSGVRLSPLTFGIFGRCLRRLGKVGLIRPLPNNFSSRRLFGNYSKL